SGLWLKEFLRRAGLVTVNPLKAFVEIGENPDIGGPIAVLMILIIADLINRQLFMLFKTELFILKGSDVLEPYKSSLMDTATATQIAVMSLINYGYYILRNSIIYYVMMWILKTERHFTSILMATAYAMFTYVIGKVIEALAILFVIPPLTIVIAVDTSVAMLSSSVTLVLINMENVEIANAMTNTYREAWENQPAPRVLSNMGYAFSIWSCLICIIALYTMFKMPKSKALIAGITPLIADAILRVVLLGGFF
ncbi:MAG: YIP1 family protein, partial [Candidatus Bathyarchaeia archaeon]